MLRWGLLASTAVTYLATACPTVLGGDNGEFSTLLHDGGVAHPPGYPAYTLWLRLFGLIPTFSPAHGAAMATALLGVAAVMMLRQACIETGASELAATVAAGVFAFSPLAWDLATHAEVFALNALLAAAIMTLASPRSSLSAERRAPLLAAVAGLGLANHHSIVLMIGTGAVGFVIAVLSTSHRLRTLAVSLAALALGLTPYAYTYLQGAVHDGRWVWGETSTLPGLLHHVMRADYGTTRLALADQPTQPLAQLSFLGIHLLEASLFVLAPVVLLGLVVALRPPRDGARAAWWVRASIALSFVLSGPLFVSLFNIAPTGTGRHVVERFHLLPWACLVPFLAVGMDALLARLPARTSVRHGAGLLGVVAAFALHLPQQRQSASPVVEDYLRNTLAAAPPHAVILGSGDMELFGFLYADRALGLRPDVTFLDPVMMLYPWYHRRLSAQLAVDLVHPVGKSLPLGALIRQLMSSGHPVLLAAELDSRALGAFTIYPLGPLLVVEPGDRQPPSPAELEARNLRIAAGYQVHGGFSTDPNSWEASAQRAYARPWRELARTWMAAGMSVDAERDRQRAALFLPWRHGSNRD